MLLALSNGMNSFLQFCTVLIIFLFVLVITWIATKWIANFQGSRSGGKNIEVIETYRLTANKYIQIIRTGEKYLAVAICKDTVSMLGKYLPDKFICRNNRRILCQILKGFLRKLKCWTKIIRMKNRQDI